MEVTKTIMNAISRADSNYVNNRGAKCYAEKNYKDAVEYYHLSAAMGNVHAISNLGYCYLYGRDIEANRDLAIVYFELASLKGDIDASYKLGDIYGSDKWGVKDKELSIYYYRLAMSYLYGDDWSDYEEIAEYSPLNEYPSLCFALGREMMPDGELNTDLSLAYLFLKKAETGYKQALMNGNDFYEKAYKNVVELIDSTVFDGVRNKIDALFDTDY